ncbi:glycine--tRNA ligase subunit beta [Psychrosphaera ytuae]|uniref:Glycine--tRNA ligase beta subunit n=1 Tax=Psychrosphaera ytuae TaxID=2820710 RepID=A0A975D9U3_9GAMM|nr:glycine--tRNA ligase subunit beta [Psychrosphaera ytuae]QTH62959.1 glycine--tRNA ligase subunit beta [Psychrosphaera ytuae]
MRENFVIELGTEELPPKALKKLAVSFKDGFEAQLKGAELAFEQIEWLAAPRRLALKVTGLEFQQADKVVEKRGPAVAAAFDDQGQPTKAAMGWARGCGIDVADADRIKTDKGEWLLHKANVPGKSLDELLSGFLSAALKQLPIPKPMRWGASDVEFIRPVHTLLALYGDRVVNAEVLGLTSSNVSQGHRFHHRGLVTISSADNYVKELEAAYVMADFTARQESIKTQMVQICEQENATFTADQDLLDEVTALVEWPVALVGTFEDKFLDVPQEALIYTMKDDQKYFPLLDNTGNLLPKFAFISNIESKDPQQVIEGNEKVIRPRLADAEFFYNTDKKQTLESRLTSLESVLFQKQLGTLKEKSERISELAGFIASKISANTEYAKRAGLLSKTDLMTEVVMEFTDIQGVMGKYYALNDGESPVVADALYQQYMPRFAGDTLPESLEACAVALADKFDTLVGIFGIGQFPKGDKDPFALRRAAIGTIRIMVEKELDLDFAEIADFAKTLFGNKLTNENVSKDVVDFMLGRFEAHYRDHGIAVELIRAVEVKRPTSALDFERRLSAVVEFSKLTEASALAAANKRVNNILSKNEQTSFAAVNEQLLNEAAEIELVKQINAIAGLVEAEFNDGNYTNGLTKLAALQQPIDNFFENVMVNAEDEAVRENRYAILGQLQGLFMHTADISVL